MKNTFKFKNSLILLLGTLLFVSNLISCSSINTLPIVNDSGQAIEDSNNQPLTTSNTSSTNISSINDIPKYSGKDIIILNNNVPNFSKSDLTTTSFEKYSPLDSLGRCGVAYSNIGTDVMPTEKRESISSVKPSGWHSVKNDVVEGKYLYNRSHLIGYQLTAENANDVKAKVVCEGANGPTTPGADEIFAKNGVTLVPDILANSGGVTVSYYEWVQNLQRDSWSFEEVQAKQEKAMKKAFDAIWAIKEEYGVDMRTAAYMSSIKRVADAMKRRGWY